jgi:hypothetical protein
MLKSIRFLAFLKNNPLKAQWSLYLPPGSTFTNPKCCPHSLFICFVWIWEQTAIISLYIISWPVFTTDALCLLRGTDWVFKFVWSYSSKGFSVVFPTAQPIDDATVSCYSSNVSVNISIVKRGRSERVRKISPLQGLDPRTIQPAANRYTEWAIPAHRRSRIHSENHFSATFAENPFSEVRFPGRLLYQPVLFFPRK